MRVGLISDTHIPRDADAIPPQVGEVFVGVDLILHGGDVYVSSILDELEAIAPVLVARGDRAELWGDARAKGSHRLTLGNLSLGLTHHVDYPESPWMRSFEDMMAMEFGAPVDILVFGSSHKPMIEGYKGVLLVNPGSPTLPMGCRGLGTVGILEIEGGKVEAWIIDLNTAEVVLEQCRRR